jgi:hypothetical protein
MGERRGAYRVLVGKPEGKRPFGRPRSRWEDDIKKDPQEVRWSGMDWIDLAWNMDKWRALVNAVMNLRVPQNAVKFVTCLELVRFSRTLLHRFSYVKSYHFINLQVSTAVTVLWFDNVFSCSWSSYRRFRWTSC